MVSIIKAFAHRGPCPPDKYSEGFNQQSLSDPYMGL